MLIPLEILSQVLCFADRHCLFKLQLCCRQFNHLVQRSFRCTPYHIFQILEFRQANRQWLLNGQALGWSELQQAVCSPTVRCTRTTLHMAFAMMDWPHHPILQLLTMAHVWQGQQLHIRWPARLLGVIGDLFDASPFANALHIAHCRPGEGLDVAGLAGWLCEPQGKEHHKKRLRINCAEWKNEFSQLVDLIVENFKHAMLACTAFELVLQIYPRYLCNDFHERKMALVNETTKELLKVNYWKEGYDNVASELRYFCRLRRIRVGAGNKEEDTRKRKHT